MCRVVSGVTDVHVCALNRAGQPSRPAWFPAPLLALWRSLCGLGATLSWSTQPSFISLVNPFHKLWATRDRTPSHRFLWDRH